MRMEEHRQGDRRSEDRIQIRIPIRFWDPHDPRTFNGFLIDESDSGAYIETDESLPLRSQIRVEGPGVAFDAVILRVFWVPPDMRASRHGGIAVRLLARDSQFKDADYEQDDAADVIAIESRRAV